MTSIDELFVPASAQQWCDTLLQNATMLQLPTPSWKPGDPERVLLKVMAQAALSRTDAAVSAIAQAGFLDYAASGTVTVTAIDGSTTTTPVTPEGGPGWLDVLASSVYQVPRIQATFAGGAEALTNTSAFTFGPFAAGSYHVGCASSKATYSNTTPLTIPPSATVGTVTGATSGTGSVIQIQTSGAHHLTTGAAVSIIGVQGIPPLASPTAWLVDVVNSTHFTLRGSTFSGSYVASAGKVYRPLVASFIADAAGSAYNSVDAFGSIDVHTVTTPVTSLLGVTVDNLATFQASDAETNVNYAARCRLKLQSIALSGPKGAYLYAALSSQQLAPTLNPPLAVSQAITRVISALDIYTGTIHVWLATATGAPTSDDVTATAAVIDAKATPPGVPVAVAAATEVDVAAVANVWVSVAANNTATQALFQAAIRSFFTALPINGFTDPGGSGSNVVPYDAVLGAIFAVAALNGIAISDATLTLNGGTSDIKLTKPSPMRADVARLSPALPTVTLHSV